MYIQYLRLYKYSAFFHYRLYKKKIYIYNEITLNGEFSRVVLLDHCYCPNCCYCRNSCIF